MSRWCVVFEEYDNFGNQGIGTDVFEAPDIGSAIKSTEDALRKVFAKNSDQITSWRVIGINIVPDIKEVKL